MMQDRTALIVGAGIGGLAAALALTRAGWRVRVFERSPTPRELGFGLMLAPNAMAALDELGVGGLVRTRGYTPRSVEIRTADGRLLRAFRTPPGGHAESLFPVMALRPALYGTLLEAIPAGVVSPASEATGFEEVGEGVRLHLSDGRVERGDVLVGADGVHSAVRTTLYPEGPRSVPSAYCGLRGVAFDAEQFLTGLDALVLFGPALEAAAVRASSNAIYWYVSMLADEMPVNVRPVEIGQQRLAQVDPRFRAIVDATRDVDLRFDRFVERPPMETWGRGRVTLLGDAAHPVLPHTGQGAAQAIEDAVALGIVLSRGDDIDGALRRYERVRARRTRAIVHAGPRIARVTTTRSRVVSVVRDNLLRVVPGSAFAVALKVQARDPHRRLRNDA